MKKVRIKWNNIIKAILFLVCIVVIAHDIYNVGFSQFITGKMMGWTWLGFLHFILVCIFADILSDDLSAELNK